MTIRYLAPTSHRPYSITWLLLIFLFSTQVGWAVSLSGQVFSVETGNLISLTRPDGEQRSVRLIGIATPRDGQLARISRRHLHMLLAGKFVSVIYDTVTAKGEILGQVLHGGSDINQRMLTHGMARFSFSDKLSPELLTAYQRAQTQAQSRRQGIWRTNRP
ncbi:MAG: thermonuclease family protein [Gammaproteobacteria bacterium]|nr:thermonuclease family protein [Gammaproteobacteria bacterium]